jgi:hypothetical protein
LLEGIQIVKVKLLSAMNASANNLAQFEDRAALDTPPASLKSELHRICGVDLTKIPGIKEQAAQIIISEVGLDMTRWF